ncbi:MAG TPA: histidine--tRNA ligase [Acidimicrobiia bacterium]|nr:histidine--tRNA ligase [Acidimicrobiia bacterium]
MSFQPPKGTDDVIAPESQAWRETLRIWEDLSERYGYPLVGLPVFEATDLFERGVGETTEVVTKQMYTFTDQGGRSVTLRPEGTAGAVRAYLNSGQQGTWKGAYSGPFFRYERPQAGRRRQFWQVGVEYIGTASPVADVEVIELGYRFISAAGLGQVALLLNSIGDPECRPHYVEALRRYLRDREAELSPESVSLIDRNPLRVLDSKADAHKLEDAPSTIDHLCDACAAHLDTVKRGLETLEIPYLEDPSLVRGLDYYTRTAFEYIATGLDAAQNAVGGGGRYDGLAEAIGGGPTPGVGFALGIDRIMLALGNPERPYLDAYLVSETGPEDALRAVSRLRADGIRVDFDAEGRSVKAQFRTAGRLEVPVVLVWRGDGEPVDVQTEEERAQLPLEEVSVWFSKR